MLLITLWSHKPFLKYGDRLKIADFKQGVQGAPGFSGGGARRGSTLNLDIDLEGRPVVRKGYAATRFGAVTGHGSAVGGGALLRRCGHRTGDACISRLQEGASWVNTGRRLFVAGDLHTAQTASHRWVDLEDRRQWYDWTLPTPTFFPATDNCDRDLAMLRTIYQVSNRSRTCEVNPSDI